MSSPKQCWVCGGTITELIAEKLGTPIAELNLSRRASNCLCRANLESIDQLLKLDYKDLMRLRNLGKHTAREIINRVKELGFD